MISNQDYLLKRQYKDAQNLTARASLHQRFSQNPYGWHRWEFEQFSIRPGESILDLGCGPADLWVATQSNLAKDNLVVLCDLSHGMMRIAAGRLLRNTAFRFITGDAQWICFQDETFDLVTANHMLYHVPDILQAVREVRRVLRPGGRFCVATNGAGHMQELFDFLRELAPDFMSENDSATRFGLENGPALLRTVFARVDIRYYEDSLWVTEVEPLIAYIGSMWGFMDYDEKLEEQCRQKITSILHTHGGFLIHKSVGIILAQD